MFNNKKVLVLAPHTDDGEFGCGGSIAKFIEQGADVSYAAFSLCEESVPEGWQPEVLENELKRAANVLGIKRSSLLIYRYPETNKRFSKPRHGICFFIEKRNLFSDPFNHRSSSFKS